MGYVRMIRSGALHECTEATVFLPVIDGELSFVKYSKEECLYEESVSAAQILENDINTLCKNYRIDTNYFRLLLNAFLTLRDPENIHLQNFFMIIPPLTINFVEYMLKAKEKITKKDKMDALFTDDGFAMGKSTFTTNHLAMRIRSFNRKLSFSLLTTCTTCLPLIFFRHSFYFKTIGSNEPVQLTTLV